MRIASLVFALVLTFCGTARAAGLTIYSRLDYAGAVARAFTAKTGIAVRVHRPPPTGLADRIAREGAKPEWSLAWFYGAPTATFLDERGLLARHLKVPAGLSDAARALVPADASAIPTGIVLGGVLVMAKAAPFAPPVRWRDLTAPAYRGLLGMADPATDTAAWGGIASLLASDGWPGGKPFVVALKAAGLHVYATGQSTIAALRTGTIQLALVRSPIAFHAAAEPDAGLQVVIPAPAVPMPALIAMAPRLPQATRQDAEAFIAYATSPAGQAVARGTDNADSAFWPVVDGAAPVTLPPLDGLETRPAAALDGHAAAAVAWFEHDIVGAPR